MLTMIKNQGEKLYSTLRFDSFDNFFWIFSRFRERKIA